MAVIDPRLIPLELIEVDRAVGLLFDRWLRYTATPLLRELGLTSEDDLSDHYAVERADGGLWLVGGSAALWTIYAIPAGRWSWATDGDG